MDHLVEHADHASNPIMQGELSKESSRKVELYKKPEHRTSTCRIQSRTRTAGDMVDQSNHISAVERHKELGGKFPRN